MDTVTQVLDLVVTFLEHPPWWLLYASYAMNAYLIGGFFCKMVPVTSRFLWRVTKLGWRAKAMAIKMTAALLQSWSDRLNRNLPH